MDPSFFEDELLNGELLWAFSPEALDLPPAVPTPPVAPKSAFVSYSRPSGGPPLGPPSDGARNIHRRMTEFLGRIPKEKPGHRGFRHMMRERQRREKLSQNYADLHSMLSSRSKADKNSIVQSAAVYVRELKGVEEKLRRRNEELKARLGRGAVAGAPEGEKIRIRVPNPSSAIDSMIAALRCLKGKDVKATAVQSDLSGHELAAVVSARTSKAAAAELERAVEWELMEGGQKHRAPFQRRSGWSQHCHVEN